MAEPNRSSPETPKSSNTDARRYSTGKPGEKAVPNYLRASTGSCHDFCKYGRKHEFEEKARPPPFLRRKAKKPPDAESSSNSNSLPNSSLKEKPKFPEIIKGQVSPVSLNRRTVASNSRALLTRSVDRQNPVSTEAVAKKKAAAWEILTESSKNRVLAPNRKQTAAGILTKSVDSKSSISGEFERKKTGPMEMKNVSAALEKKQTAARKLLTKSIDSESSITGEFERRKTDTLERNKESAVKLRTSLDSKTHKYTKHFMPSPSGKLKQVSLKPRLSLPDSLAGQKTKIAAKGVNTSPRALLSSRGIVKGYSNPKAPLSLKPTLKVQLSSKALLSPKTFSSEIGRKTASPRRNHKAAEVQSPLHNQHSVEKGNDPHQLTEELKESNSHFAREKTLYVIKMETENKVLESDHNAELSSPPLVSAKSPLPESSISSSHNEEEEEEETEYSETDTEDDYVSETEFIEEAHPFEVEQKRRGRKVRLVHLEDIKESQPFKVRFRQGRVIEMEPERDTPRRLKFRKGRSIGENQNLRSDGRKSFKRRGSDGNGNDSNPNSEKVVLRHQDAHGKKDAQGLLFNNVIEETASKLVETRKSKVKALVGAFETVISLQDAKPTAN